MSAAKKQAPPPRPRQESAHVNDLSRAELELPDGRYLLAYARVKSRPHA